MEKRKKISQTNRLTIYNRYKGHCAYCGCKLEYKDMQVDHVVSIYAHDGDNAMDNYMPACRMCNQYKSTYTLDKFREQLGKLTERLEKQFIYRLAKKYGLIEECPQRIKFYFEILEEQQAVIINKMNTAEFKHFKLHSDSTLKGMTKEELISYIHMLYHNWSAGDESYLNVMKHAKLLDKALDKACEKLQDETVDDFRCPGEQFGFIPSCCSEESCDGSNMECWKEWCMKGPEGEQE